MPQQEHTINQEKSKFAEKRDKLYEEKKFNSGTYTEEKETEYKRLKNVQWNRMTGVSQLSRIFVSEFTSAVDLAIFQ